MATYVALLRAVDVGGTGKLPMSELRHLCERCDFTSVRTYIASGNVVFSANGREADVQSSLQSALELHVGKPLGVLIRSAEEMAAVLASNPYSTRSPNLVHVVFLNSAPPRDLLANISGRADEDIARGLREIYVHYPQGQGGSKLKLPPARTGTARNINTVARLAEMAGA